MHGSNEEEMRGNLALNPRGMLSSSQDITYGSKIPR
jgi:hypothetical protein